VAIEVHGNKARWFFDGRQMMRTTSLVRSADGVQALIVNGATVALMAWTVNSAAPWKSLDAIGVDAIITDRPAELTGWNGATQYGDPPLHRQVHLRPTDPAKVITTDAQTLHTQHP
jgi:hypothetical protein